MVYGVLGCWPRYQGVGRARWLAILTGTVRAKDRQETHSLPVGPVPDAGYAGHEFAPLQRAREVLEVHLISQAGCSPRAG